MMSGFEAHSIILTSCQLHTWGGGGYAGHKMLHTCTSWYACSNVRQFHHNRPEPLNCYAAHGEGGGGVQAGRQDFICHMVSQTCCIRMSQSGGVGDPVENR